MNEEISIPYAIYNADVVQTLLKRFEAAKQKRQQFVPIWQEVASYILPYRGGFYEVESSGSISAFDKSPDVYDDTAPNALLKAAAALYSYTANPATQWFSLSLIATGNSAKTDFNLQEILDDADVKTYLEDAAEITGSFINARTPMVMHALCQELLAFSASGFYIIEDSEKIFNIQPISVKHFFVLNDSSGGVGEVFCVKIVSNEQCVDLFLPFNPAMASEIIKEAEAEPLKERTLLHIVKPRKNRDSSIPDVLNMPYASYWIDLKTKTILLESGFEEMPYGIARINVPADSVFGFSPAMNVRHTVKSLNKLVKQKLTAGDLSLTPSMDVPIDTYLNPLSLKPAAQNFRDPDSSNKAEPLHTIGNFQINTETIRDAREQVRQGLLIDLIEQTNKDNTYQAMQEQLLQLKLMSPWQGGIERDCLKPLVIRAFNILDRKGGILPKRPEILEKAIEDKKVQLKIIYDSPLSRAQQHFKLTAVEQAVMFGASLSEAGALEFFNLEEVIRLYVFLVGAPSKILLSKTDLNNKRKAQEKMNKAQTDATSSVLQTQQMREGAATAKDMAAASQLAQNQAPPIM